MSKIGCFGGHFMEWQNQSHLGQEMTMACPFSLAAATLAQWAGHTSSPHLNAAITRGLLASHHMSFLSAVFYRIAQIGVQWLATGAIFYHKAGSNHVNFISIPLYQNNSFISKGARAETTEWPRKTDYYTAGTSSGSQPFIREGSSISDRALSEGRVDE